jgi:HPt (histidine-containing phosphotransfer) domain-containing protein
MDDYISKPFEELDLVRMILKYTDHEQHKHYESATQIEGSAETNVISLPSAILMPEDVALIPVMQVEPLYSYDRIAKMGNGNKDLIRKIREVFLKQMPYSLSDLQDAVQKEDYEQIYMIAHRSKSSLVSFSADQAKELANNMEVLAKEKGSIDEIRHYFTQFSEMVNSILEDMEQNVV